VPAAVFVGMDWPADRWGASAKIHAGKGFRDHVRFAIQFFSMAPPERRIYLHTGWRQVGGRWVYLHAKGAVGEAGTLSDVRTDLSGGLAGYELPDLPEGGALREAVRASLGLAGATGAGRARRRDAAPAGGHVPLRPRRR